MIRKREKKNMKALHFIKKNQRFVLQLVKFYSLCVHHISVTMGVKMLIRCRAVKAVALLQ